MSLKCPACGLVNSNDALFCQRCGRRLPAPDERQTATGDSSIGTGRKSQRPAFFFVGSILLLMSLIFGFVGIHHQLRATRCSATTQGLLEPKYTAETLTQLEIPYSESYLVRYSFQVQGRNYEGGDRLSTKPAMREVTVHYDPADPRDSLIELQPVSISWILLTLGLGVFGILFFVWGVHKK